MFVPGWFQRVLHHFCHLDNPLLQSPRTILLPWSISDKGCLPLGAWYVFGLRCLNLPIHKLLKREARFVRCGLYLLFRRAIHCTCRVIKVFAMQEGNKVFKLRLDNFSRRVTLLCNGIVADVAVAVYLKCESVPRRGLYNKL